MPNVESLRRYIALLTQLDIPRDYLYLYLFLILFRFNDRFLARPDIISTTIQGDVLYQFYFRRIAKHMWRVYHIFNAVNYISRLLDDRICIRKLTQFTFLEFFYDSCCVARRILATLSRAYGL